MTLNTNNAFGNDATFAQLAEKIRGFSFDDSSPTEQHELIGALKILAEETVCRWENVRKLEKDLQQKLSMADIREAMSEVLVVTREGKRIEQPAQIITREREFARRHGVPLVEYRTEVDAEKHGIWTMIGNLFT